MKTTIENLEDSRIRVDVEVDAKDVNSKIASTYKDFARKYNFPGFRKGKAPRPVVDNAFGKEAILAQVTEDVINDSYPKVIEENKIFPVGSPDFGNPDMVVEGKTFKFSFEQNVKPDYTLSNYDDVEIELPKGGATKTEIEEQLKAIVDRYENYEDAGKDAKVGKDDCADLEIVAKKEDGTEVLGLTSKTAFFAPNTGIYSDAFGKEIVGMKAGDEKKFTLDVADDESSVYMSDVAGQKIDFDVICKAVKVVKKPELTDEWVKETLGFEDIEDMKKHIEESITTQKEEVIPQIKENECALELVKRLNEEAPAALVEQTESQLLQDFFGQLQRQGINFDQYLMMQGIEREQFKEDVKRQAKDNVMRDLALDAWAKKYGIEATDEDVTLEFERAGVENPKELEKQWKNEGRLYLIREGIIRQKAMEDVMNKAKVTELDFDEFNKSMEKRQEAEKKASAKKSTKKASTKKDSKDAKAEDSKEDSK